MTTKFGAVFRSGCIRSVYAMTVDDEKQRLVEVWSLVRLRAYLNQMLSSQVIDIAYALLIHPLLKTAPNFVVNWV